MAEVQPIPEGCEAAIPYRCVKSGSDTIDFYRRTFGATQKHRLEDPRKKNLSVEEMKRRDARIFGGA